MIKYLVAIFISLSASSEAAAIDREKSICGFFKEPFLFWLWSKTAPTPDSSKVSGIEFVESIEYETSDKKTLRGYRYSSNDGNGHLVPPKGYVLMALGNAMISDQIIGDLYKFAENNYDVYIYDYRGYGNSEGKRRINAIIEDYKEIAISLNNLYERKLFYGISLGGAVILNVIGSGVEYDSAVIDSSPSLLSNHGCPKRIDPIANLPEDSSKLLIITGQQDKVLKDSLTSALRISAKKKGATTIHGENYSHPFMDQNVLVHNERMGVVLNHLVVQASANNNE